jgi:hypothetical protein
VVLVDLLRKLPNGGDAAVNGGGPGSPWERRKEELAEGSE